MDKSIGLGWSLVELKGAGPLMSNSTSTNGWTIAGAVAALLTGIDFFASSYEAVSTSVIGTFAIDCGSGYSVLTGSSSGGREACHDYRGIVLTRLVIGVGLAILFFNLGEKKDQRGLREGEEAR